MGPLMLKRCGILCIVAGLLIISVSIYTSYLYDFTLLTEVFPGMTAIYLGVHLVRLTKEQFLDVSTPDISESGKASPFYFELEPNPMCQRELPPIPNEYAHIYSSVSSTIVVTDKM